MGGLTELKNELPSLEQIAGDAIIKKSASEFASPCPGDCQGGEDRFFWKAGENAGYCRQCEKTYSTLDVYMRQNGMTNNDIPKIMKTFGIASNETKPKKYKKKQKQATNKAEPNDIAQKWKKWNKPIKGTAAEEYLEKRGITFSDSDYPPGIKFNSWEDDSGTHRRLLFPVTNIKNDKRVEALSSTFIDEDLHVDNRIQRGSIAAQGRGIWFYRKRAKTEKKLIVGEGVETVLSAMQATGINGVSGLDTSKILSLDLPDNAKEVYILVDEDILKKGAKKGYAGQLTSIKLAKRLVSEGLTVWIVTPTNNTYSRDISLIKKTDFNDLTKEEILTRFEHKLDVDAVQDWNAGGSAGVDEPEDTSDSDDEIEKAIKRYNKRFAMIVLSGSIAVLHEEKSLAFDGIETNFWKKTTFLDYYCNDTLIIQKPDGSVKRIQAANAWMTSEKRRSYKGVVFDPTCKKYPSNRYNLFNGFNTEPKKGCCDAVLQMMQNEVCAGNNELFEYLCAWFAQIIREPWKKTGTALIFSSGQGCGKSLLMRFFRKIFEGYFIQIINSNLLVGRFNDLLQGKLIVFADEAVFAGNKETASKLKGLITENKMIVEIKNVSAYEVDSYVNLVIASNDHHVANLDNDDRRNVVFAFDETNKNDWDYFDPVWKELRSNGAAALMHYLFNTDFSHIKLNEIPETAAREEQKQMSLDSVESFWLNVLERAYILTPDNRMEDNAVSMTLKDDNQSLIVDAGIDFEWPKNMRIRCSFIYDEYILFCNKSRNQYPESSRTFWAKTRRKNSDRSIFSNSLETRKSNSVTSVILGDIEELRKDFSQSVCDVEWHDEEDESGSEVPF